MVAKSTAKPSARERLLAAADELFYEEGVHTVGIDRVIEHAGVAKGSLYNTFGSKDELIRAYLSRRHEMYIERITKAIDQHSSPRDRLLAVFDALGELRAREGFRGCPFTRASAEARPGDAAQQVSAEYRQWVRGLFTELAAENGAADPVTLGWQLDLVYTGASVSARTDRSLAAVAMARGAAEVLLDAALAAGPGRD